MTTQLNTLAAKRLRAYKAEAEERNAKYPEGTRLTWKQNRYPRPHFLRKSSLNRSEDNTKIFIDSLEDFPGTVEGDAAQFIRLDYTGWYTDNFQNDLIKGAVISIRHPHKLDEDGAHRAYMPATYHTDWDGATVYNEIYDNKEDAARSADGEAEREAEECRDYDAKYQAETETEDLKNELHDLNKKTLALIKEVKGDYTPGKYPAICQAIKNEIKNALEERTRIFNRIEELNDNYWAAVDY